VISTTDHGIAFPAMKCHLTDHGMGVSLILRGPQFRGGRVCGAMVSHVDLFPTVCELANLSTPKWLVGHSLKPLMDGTREEIREDLFGEVTYHAAYEPQRAARTRRWKYIRRFDDRARPNLPNCDDGPSKDHWLAAGLRERPVPHEQLFDLCYDPNEACNLAGQAESAEALAKMRGRLERYMRETHDPLLMGPVLAPKGARVNDPNGLSPSEKTVEFA